MKNYKILNTCKNCDNSFVYMEYDGGNEYYCLLKNLTKLRPKCGSIYMNEGWFGDKENKPLTDEEIDAEIAAWEVWSEENYVSECGICDNWTKRLLKAKEVDILEKSDTINT